MNGRFQPLLHTYSHFSNTLRDLLKNSLIVGLYQGKRRFSLVTGERDSTSIFLPRKPNPLIAHSFLVQREDLPPIMIAFRI